MKIKQIFTSTRCHFMLLTLLNRTKYFAEVVIIYVEQAVHTLCECFTFLVCFSCLFEFISFWFTELRRYTDAEDMTLIRSFDFQSVQGVEELENSTCTKQ